MDKRTTVLRLIHYMTGLVYDAVYELKFTPGMSLSQIEAEYNRTLTEIMTSYMQSERPVTAFRNEMGRAANDTMTLAGYAGWADGGGIGTPNTDVMNWINSRISSEMAFIEDVFWRLKELRKSGTPEEQQSFIAARAQGYTASLQGIYNYAFMQGGATIMGVWRLGATEKHCAVCDWLASPAVGAQMLTWFASQGYIPRQAGSRTLTCGGWNCDCGIYDPETGKQLV